MSLLKIKKSLGNSYQANRSFENDLFKHRKEAKKRRKFLAFFLFLLILGGIGWLATRPFFFVHTVDVSGTETVDNQEVSTHVLEMLRNDRFLGLSRAHILRRKQQAIHRSLNDYPFASIEVNQKKRTLYLTVTEKAIGGLVHGMNTWMLYSLDGEYVRNLSEEEVTYVSNTINDMPVDRLYFHKGTPIVEFGSQQYPVEKTVPILRTVKKMHEAMTRQGYTPTMHILADEHFMWAEARMREGYVVLYDLTREAQEQVKQLHTVDQELKASGTARTSIDVRFGGRVYVK